MSNTKRYVDYDYGLEYDTNRDRKKSYKPGKAFKKPAKRQRKRKEKEAFIHGREDPRFRKEDVWNWN